MHIRACVHAYGVVCGRNDFFLMFNRHLSINILRLCLIVIEKNSINVIIFLSNCRFIFSC